jgi:hypothetical protein
MKMNVIKKAESNRKAEAARPAREEKKDLPSEGTFCL